MMEELKALREEIDLVDRELAQLFEKRMEIAGRIGELKKACGLQVLDSGREAQVREERKNYIKNPELRPYWSELLEELMKISKEYQWTLNEDCPSLRK